MNFQISLALLQAAFIISFQDEYGGYNKTARKHYGLSFHSKCTNYVKSFTCMTTCKSIGFQVFRMDFRCKCSCHGLKTTTILPFFKWRTNGTTKALPRTQSPNLYHIAGTLSPARTEPTEETSTPAPPVTCAPPESTTSNVTTSIDDESATTGDATTITDTSDTEADDGATTETDSGATTAAEGNATTAAEDGATTEAAGNDTTAAEDNDTTPIVGNDTNDNTTSTNDTDTT